MKKEDISEIISGIDEKFIKEATSPVKKKNNIRIITGLAASLAVIITVFVFMNYDRLSTVPVKPESTSQNVTDNKIYSEAATDGLNEIATEALIETVTEPAIEIGMAGECVTIAQWTDRPIQLQYTQFSLASKTYTTGNCEIKKADTDTFIADAKLTGYDFYEDKNHFKDAKVYSVKKINPDCAVAVFFEEENKYYVYINSEYTPDTLEDFINDLNLRENLIFTEGYYYENTEKQFLSRTYKDFDDAVIWEKLLDNTDIRNISDNTYHEQLVSLSVDIPILGYRNIYLAATKDGYITTNILGSRKCFFIGTDKAESIAEYLYENIEYTENIAVYEYPDDTQAAQSGEAFISPPYDPSTGNPPPVADGSSQSPPSDYIVEETTRT